MKPMLDDLELPLVQEITTHDRRVLAEHKPPGMEGSLLQNLGRRPARLVLWGVVVGDDAQNTIEKLDEKFRSGGPFPFVADISSDSEIDQIVIDDFQLQEIAGISVSRLSVLSLNPWKCLSVLLPGYQQLTPQEGR